ncbi:MAG: hypothetical protein A2202_04115 [Bdellovibrionales bacterium RIFOXYA1_FULL_36_14]|nr:MAG: hypothetical protein A2202_04115 [Bdellovibrionales bacterium RIFOXYA1_FULL_36_14]
MDKKILKKIGDFTNYYPLFFTLIFVVILFQYNFHSMESIFYDLRLKYDFGISFKDNIILIVLDEESDEFLGEQYPYTYASHNKLIRRVMQDQPLVINYLVNLQGSVAKGDKNNLINFKNSILEYRESGGSFRFGTGLDEWGEKIPPRYLQDLGYSLAMINVDNAIFSKDNVARRALLNISGEPSIHFWTANRFRLFQGKKEIDTKSVLGSYYVREADATFALFRYATPPLEDNLKIKKIPFHRVVVGNFPRGYFTDKIVLVGSSYISKPSDDYSLSPFDKENLRSSKLSIHANIIQCLIDNKTITQIPIEFSYVVSIIIAVILSLVVFKFQPIKGLMITLGLMFGIILISYLLFGLFGYWFYMTHPLLTVLVIYYIWVPFKAIGEYKRRFAIQEESKLIKQVDGLKRNFISLMSHDLKTPVAKIAGIADVALQQNKGNLNLEKNLFSIIESTKELNKFITSILDLTKVESQKLNLQLTSKDINPIIESVLEGLRFEASRKNISFIAQLEPLYPINIDVTLINRVLSNMIENAIKYSGENSTVIVKTYDDEKWVYIEVSDNGAGIPAEDLPFVFEKFYRVKNDASHKIKGTGLGLYLVRYFVELHGGQISVESSLNEGTTFQIKLKNA